MAFHSRLIGAHFDTFRIGKGGECAGHVFRHVNQHRARATATRDIKSFFDGRREVVHVFDKEAVLDAGAGDADRIHFLKGVVANQRRRHLPGEDNQRDGIGIGGGDAGHGVGETGTGGDDGHANFAGSARVAVRLVYRALLMAGEDVGDVFLLVNRVIDVQHGTAGIAEYVLDLLFPQCLDDDFCTVQMMFFLRHSLASLLIRAGNSTQATWRRQAHFAAR